MTNTLLLQVVVQVPEPPMPPLPPDPTIVYTPTPPDWVPMIAIAFFVMIAFIAVGVPIARAIARRMDRRDVGTLPSAASGDVTARLERIEHAVEAMAVEVERISEGQRFMTKLMGEMRGLPAPNSLEAGRPIAARSEEPR